MIHQHSFEVFTAGRGSYSVTHEVQKAVTESGINTGLCHIFVEHTSASLILCENADPQVRKDLETFMAHVVPDGSPLFKHTSEGPDDMPAHVRSILTHNDLTIPLRQGQCALGIWQGVYLWEHRHHGHQRRITITVQGE